MTSHLVRDGDATARGAVAGAAALFGSAAIATELLEPSLSAPAIAAWRIIIGGVALVVVSCCAGAAPWQYPRHLRITIAGALCVIAFQVGFFVAVGRLSAAVATMITIGTCPLAAGLAHRLRHRSVLGRRWWAGVSLAWGGIALMTTQGASDVVGAAVLPAGFAAAVAGRHPFGDASTLAAVTYAGLISTAVAYVLWARGLHVLSLPAPVAGHGVARPIRAGFQSAEAPASLHLQLQRGVPNCNEANERPVVGPSSARRRTQPPGLGPVLSIT